MVLIEKLKGIIPPSLYTSAFHYDIKLDFDTPKSKTSVLFKSVPSEKIIYIYVNKLSKAQESLLKRTIKSFFKEGSTSLIAEKSIPLLEKLYSYKNNEDERILTFFKGVLSPLDFSALRDSLFLRSEFIKHGNVSSLKNDINNRYGVRGNIISNMCTAGYFESTMIPLYNISTKDFYEYWDLAINRGITALFVNSGMNTGKISDEIKRMLKSAKDYGLSSIHIHGIGEKNIKNIKNCIEREKDSLGFKEKNLFVSKEKLDVLVVELIL